MTNPFITFQKFNDPGLAMELGALLDENDIEYELEDKSNFGLGFSDSSLLKEYRVKLRKEDFSKADELLQKVFEKQIDEAPGDHYLFDFSDEELMDVVSKRDEWSQFDYVLAQKILRERGKEIKAEDRKELDKQRMAALAKPDKRPATLIIVGYVLAALGGIGGFFVSWHLLSYKKLLPNGETVYGYMEADRKHGTYILWMSLAVVAYWMLRLAGIL